MCLYCKKELKHCRHKNFICNIWKFWGGLAVWKLVQRSVVAQSGPFSKGVQEEQHVQGTPCCRDCSPWPALLLGTQQYQQAPSEPMCSCWFNKYRTNLDCMSIPESSVKQFHLPIPQQRSRTRCPAYHQKKLLSVYLYENTQFEYFLPNIFGSLCYWEAHPDARQEHCTGKERIYCNKGVFNRKFFGSMLLPHMICKEPQFCPGPNTSFHSLRIVPSLCNIE